MQPERSTLNISCDQQSSLNKALYGRILSAIVVSLFAMFAVAAAQAQTVTVYGQLGNFDVVNHTGHDAHGFEIEVQGIQPQDIYYTFSVQRYGSPQITSTPTGVLVRWESPYAGGAFTKSTIPRAPGTNFA